MVYHVISGSKSPLWNEVMVVKAVIERNGTSYIQVMLAIWGNETVNVPKNVQPGTGLNIKTKEQVKYLVKQRGRGKSERTGSTRTHKTTVYKYIVYRTWHRKKSKGGCLLVLIIGNSLRMMNLSINWLSWNYALEHRLMTWWKLHRRSPGRKLQGVSEKVVESSTGHRR